MPPFHPAAGLVQFAVFLSIGIAFGAVLEASGFGDSRKLAGQFYLRDMAVLKVMFTGIIVAAVLIHLASALGLIDLQRVWINPTYLWPGILGGLIMGVGFIVGGFCPGTSLVAASTFKLDGVAFVLGGLGGVFLFGETVQRFDGWWHSSFFGRFTVDEWLGLPKGVVLILLVAMALGMFVLGEVAEKKFGAGVRDTAAPARRRRRIAPVAAAAILALAALTAMLGQPTAARRWSWIAGRSGSDIEKRAIYVDPGEVVELKRDFTLAVRILDVRSESDYNLFHIAGSRRIDAGVVSDPALIRGLLGAPENRILFLVGNGEKVATEVWKKLKAQGVINVYVVEGGINGWLDAFPPSPCVAVRAEPGVGDDLRWRFLVSVGEEIPSAHPEVFRRDPVPDCASAQGADAGRTTWFDGRERPARDFTKKVVLQRKVVAKGGCG
jgi:rhodanese-related sulfurtransferase